MPFQIVVREIKPPLAQIAGSSPPPSTSEQIYEQTVESLDLSKLIAAVNHKPRVRKAKTAATPART